MAEKLPCSPDDIDSAAIRAKQLNLCFGPTWVEVLAINDADKIVKLRAAGRERKIIEFSCKWDKNLLWADCPSTLKATNDSMPRVGDQGTLYIEKQFAEKNGIAINAKWPDCLPADPSSAYQPLRVWPISIKMRCIELFDGLNTETTIDLLDPTLCSPNQSINLNQGSMDLLLSQNGFYSFPVTFPNPSALKNAVDLIESVNAERKTDTSSDAALKLAKAWMQIAIWRALVAEPVPPERKQHIEDAKKLLDRIKGSERTTD
jgi:hypothetical protein